MAQSAKSGKFGQKPGIRKRLKAGRAGNYRQAIERPNDADRLARIERWKATIREKIRVAAQEAADEAFGPAGMPWGTLFEDLETLAVAGGDLFLRVFMTQATAHHRLWPCPRNGRCVPTAVNRCLGMRRTLVCCKPREGM